jgi:NAD-dependent DNA ligase
VEEKESIAKEAAENRTQYIFENQRLKQLIEEQKKAHNEEIAKLESHIAEREARIRDLTKKDAKTLASLEPDGEIILAESELGAAWIDLGRVNNIRKGLRFKVFRYIKGGRPKEKGTIEVKNVNDNHSYCAIIETKDPRDPIVKGDYYISPLFDKNEKKIFVFAGELVNLRYSRQELKKKIEEAGAAVELTVSIHTDFLIAGKNAEADEAFTKALQFGVIIMREKDLFEYLGD